MYTYVYGRLFQNELAPVSCFCISTESASLSRATASVMPPQRWISSLFLLLLKDRLRRAAEAVWLTCELGLCSRATKGGIPLSFNTCKTRGLRESAQLRNTVINHNPNYSDSFHMKPIFSMTDYTELNNTSL